MQLIVFIGEEHQVYNFDKKQVLVGSHPRCDIVLNYEGVGRAHLRFIEKDNEYYLQDLKSGFSTEVNQREMKPGSAIKYSTAFAVEIGGILLKIEEDDASDLGKELFFDEDGFEIPSQNRNDESSVLDEINRKFEEEHGTDRSKFRPNLYSEEPSDRTTGSFKLSDVQLDAENKESLLEKIGSKKVNVKKSRRKLKKVNVTSNVQRFSLGSVLAIGVVLLIAAYVFYSQHYSKNRTKIAKPTIEKSLILMPGKLTKLIGDIGYHSQNIQKKGCEVTREICLLIKPDNIYKDAESIQYAGKSIIVYMREDSLLAGKDILAADPRDIDVIKKEIEENYGVFFDYEKFKDSGNKAPGTQFEFPADDYRFHVLMLARLLNKELFELMKKEELIDITVYGLEIDIDGKFEITHYMNLLRDTLQFNLTRKDKVMQDLRLVFNHNLSLDIKSKFSAFAKTELNEFSDEKTEEFIKNKKFDKFMAYSDLNKCNESWSRQFCDTIHDYIRSGKDGVVTQGDLLIVVADTQNVKLNFQEKYKEPYSEDDFFKLINYFQKADVNGLESWQAFKNDEYFEIGRAHV